MSESDRKNDLMNFSRDEEVSLEYLDDESKRPMRWMVRTLESEKNVGEK